MYGSWVEFKDDSKRGSRRELWEERDEGKEGRGVFWG